ncbi:hypothetical protein SOCEGT47_058250 [Sorangium cellulosum]|uniref:Secreted protein n=1 Tax=Sorangium cellulosum TaxID=56 RepID=A0A4P2Q7L9_SORCE|nr:hypothetical protein [Sorangium cellulosum]AUX25281.1 hypothetical protein SOCEGT47_058250 [Sorangium cellulosum]
MRSVHLVSIGSTALLLATTAISAGCGDDDTEPADTTTTTASTGSAGGEDGAGEGGAGAGGAGEGGATGDETCVTCSAPLLLGADIADLCEVSRPKYVEVTTCICDVCGAAEGDSCYTSCTTDEAPSADCEACGRAAALDMAGECAAEGTACAQDRGE